MLLSRVDRGQDFRGPSEGLDAFLNVQQGTEVGIIHAYLKGDPVLLAASSPFPEIKKMRETEIILTLTVAP